MRTLGNILWHFPFFGFISAILVYLFGILLTATVIAAPVGIGLMEFGKFLFAPFGRTMISKSELKIEQNSAWKAYSTIVMIVYLPFGIFFALCAVVQVCLLFLTIVGIPVALVIAKSLGTYLNPVNKKCVSSAVSDELERRKGQTEINKYLGEGSPGTENMGTKSPEKGEHKYSKALVTEIPSNVVDSAPDTKGRAADASGPSRIQASVSPTAVAALAEEPTPSLIAPPTAVTQPPPTSPIAPRMESPCATSPPRQAEAGSATRQDNQSSGKPTASGKVIALATAGTTVVAIAIGAGYWYGSRRSVAEVQPAIAAPLPSAEKPSSANESSSSSQAFSAGNSVPSTTSSPTADTYQSIDQPPSNMPSYSPPSDAVSGSNRSELKPSGSGLSATFGQRAPASTGRRKEKDAPVTASVAPSVSAPPTNSIANPIMPTAPTQPVATASTIDDQYNGRAAAECARGIGGLFCRETIKQALCKGKWSDSPASGQSICKNAAQNTSQQTFSP